MLACFQSAFILAALGAAEYPAPHAVEHFRITRSEFREQVAGLDLSGERRADAEAIYAEYAGAFREALEAYRAAIGWLDAIAPGNYDASDPGFHEFYYADYHSMGEVWRRAARGLEQRYFDDLAALAAGGPAAGERLARAKFRHRVLASIGDLDYRPYGAELDAITLVQAVAEESLDDPEIASQLAAYESSVEELLQQVDQRLWRYEYDRRQTFDGLRDAIRADSETDISRWSDAVVETISRLPVLYWKIRRVNERAVNAVAAHLPDDEADELRGGASQKLHPFMYESQDDGFPRPQALLRTGLKRRDLTDQQRAALLAIRTKIAMVRTEAIPRINALYEQTISPESYRAGHRAWIESLVAYWRYREHIDEVDPNEVDRQAFEEAVEAWRGKLASFEKQIRSVLPADQRTNR